MLQAGPGKGAKKTKPGNASAPTGGYVRAVSTTLWHEHAVASVGFLGDWFLLPKNRSFSNLSLHEGTALAKVTGIMHRTSTTQRTHPDDPLWSPCVAPAGGEGTRCPGGDNIGGTAPENGLGYANGGTFTWYIPWYYSVSPGTLPGTSTFTVKHYFTCDGAGTTTITKQSPTYTATLNAASSQPPGW